MTEAQEEYKKRSHAVEPPFGVLKQQLNTVHVTGQEEVKNRITLKAIGYNLKRLENLIKNNVEESNSLIFFPTMSSLAEECSWINYSAIQDYVKKNNFVELRFENNKKIDIDMSKISLENQLARSSRLESIIRNRRRK